MNTMYMKLLAAGLAMFNACGGSLTIYILQYNSENWILRFHCQFWALYLRCVFDDLIRFVCYFKFSANSKFEYSIFNHIKCMCSNRPNIIRKSEIIIEMKCKIQNQPIGIANKI